MRLRTITWTAAVCLMSAGIAPADILDTWLGGTGNWSSLTGWSAGSPNNNGSTVYAVTIASGGTDQVTLDTNFTVNSLAVGGSTGYSILQSGPGSLTPQINGALTVGQTGTLFLSNGDAMTISGSATNSGSVSLSSAASLGVAGNLTNSNAVGLGNGAALSVGGTLTNEASGGFGVGGVANVNAFSNSGTTIITGTLNVTGGGVGVTDIAAGSSIQLGNLFSQTGTFSVVNGGVATNALANLSTVEGYLVLQNSQTTDLSSLAVSSSGTVSVLDGTTLTVSGDLTNSGSVNIANQFSAGVLNVGGTLTNEANAGLGVGGLANVNAFSNSGTTIITGTLNVTGGGVGVTDIAAGSSIQLGNLFSQTGTFSVVNGGVATNALANLSTVEGYLVLQNSQTTDLSSLAVSSSGTVSVLNGTALTVSGDLTNSGSVNIANQFSAGVLNVGGTLTNEANAGLSVGGVANVNALSNAGGIEIVGTLNITGGGPGVTDIPAGTTIQLGNLFSTQGTINVINGGAATDALANLTTVEGTLNLGNGQTTTLAGSLTNSGEIVVFNSGTTLAVNGNLTNDQIIIVGGGDDLIVAGNLINNALGGGLGIRQNANLVVGGTLFNYNYSGGFYLDGTACIGHLDNGGEMTIGPDGSLNGPGCSNPLASGTFTEEISSNNTFGVITFEGDPTIGGTLDVVLNNGLTPTVGESFDIMNFVPGDLYGTFSGIQNDYFNHNTEQWVVTYDNADGEVLLTAEAAPTPEPGETVPLGLGVALLGWWGLRKKGRDRASAS